MRRALAPVLLLVILGSSTAFAAEPSPAPSLAPSPAPIPVSAVSASLTLQPRIEDHAVPGLTWEKLEFPVHLEVHGSELRSYVAVSLLFKNSEWTLSWEGQVLEPGKDGRCAIRVPVRGTEFPFVLTAVGPVGQVERIFGKFGILDEEAYKKELEQRQPRPWVVVPSFALGVVSYKDTRIQPFSQVAFVGKVMTGYRFPASRWDVSSSAFLTVLQVVGSADVTARFFGLNLRTGYALASVREPWRVTINGGFYYTTTLFSPATFGYRNVGGPQIFPTVRTMLANGDIVSGYLKFSPVSDGVSILSLEDREFALGGAYSRLYSGKHLVSLTLDVASLHLFLRNKIEISSTSVSLGLAYAL